MTAATEAKLAREAEISYATIAMVTDYDCWHEEHGAVDVASVVKVMQANAAHAARLLATLIKSFPAEHDPCPIGSDTALTNAIMTDPGLRDPLLMAKLDAVAARVLNS
jgi:5'-methylthioadenosine phosphorylase